MEEKKQVYRNEWKYVISLKEAELLQKRLEPILSYDSHAVNGTYVIRSLYFDDYANSAYEQKLMGVFERQKWRIRIYNYKDSLIALERKKKKGNYVYKEMVKLNRREFQSILDCDFRFLLSRPEPLCQAFYVECMTKVLRPKVIVDYDRRPMVYEAGTVRITLDSFIRAAYGSFDIFDQSLPTLPAIEPERLVLEVKYTEFLPKMLEGMLPTNGQEFTSFSKYVACYDAAHHITNVCAGINKSPDGWRREE